jgi:thiopeptide-type bacteriocin biosynthesis protein
VGSIGESVQLDLPPRRDYRRHTRVDGAWIHDYLTALQKDEAVRERSNYRPNECLYRVCDQWRYPETRVHSDRTPRFLVAIDDDDALRSALDVARNGATRDAIASALADRLAVPLEDARAYVSELIDEQVLLSEFRPVLTGAEALADTLRLLRTRFANHPHAAALQGVLDEMGALDHLGIGEAGPARQRSVIELLRSVHPAEAVKAPIRMELHKPAEGVSLNEGVIEDLLRGVDLLQAWFGRPGGDHQKLGAFREAFEARFGDAEVPLLRALDDQVGVTFDPSASSTAISSPLLATIGFEPAHDHADAPWHPESGALLRILQRALQDGEMEIHVDPATMPAVRPAGRPAMTESFVVNFTIAAEDAAAVERRDYSLVIHGISGPSGARTLGRFCSLDEPLHRRVQAHLRAQESLDAEAVHAEVVHLPSPSTLHVVARPVLREYEVPLLGRSGAPEDRQIALEDLTLSLVGDRFVIRSTRLGRPVRIHLTTAHNFRGRGMMLYRFLCMIQGQGVLTSLGWNWGPMQSSTFLPRVRFERLVLAEARWRFEASELRELCPPGKEPNSGHLAAWRARWHIPRYVGWIDGDQVLPVDLENPASVASFIDVACKQPVVLFREIYPGPDALCVRGEEGGYVHEILLPLVRKHAVAPSEGARRSRPVAVADGAGDCLYAKLYIAESAADRVLQRLVTPLVEKVDTAGWMDRWFFIRYRDPQFHLRVRFFGEPDTLLKKVLPALFEFVEPFRQQDLVWRVTLESYRPEHARYHGPSGVAIAERVFHADSESALAMLALTSGDQGAVWRAPLLLLGMDRMLDDFQMDLRARADLLARVAESRARLLAFSKTMKVRAGELFRTQRALLHGILEEGVLPKPLTGAGAIFERRSRRIAPLLEDDAVRDLLHLQAPDLLHLSNNRVHRCSILQQEAILFDFLSRIYQSRLARKKDPAVSISPAR